MGIDLNTDNRPALVKLVNEDRLLSHDDNTAHLIVQSLVDITIYVPLGLPPGFYTTIVQIGVGKAILVEVPGVSLINATGVNETDGIGQILKVFGGLPTQFIVENAGGTGGGGGGGDTVPPMIKVVSADFTTDTDYDNEDLVDQDLAIFLNQINRYLEDSEWEHTATGIRILIDEFDASANEYTLYITNITPLV